jgi:hypothetical protein
MRYMKYKLSRIAESESSLYNTVQYGEKPFAGQHMSIIVHNQPWLKGIIRMAAPIINPPW